MRRRDSGIAGDPGGGKGVTRKMSVEEKYVSIGLLNHAHENGGGGGGGSGLASYSVKILRLSSTDSLPSIDAPSTVNFFTISSKKKTNEKMQDPKK